MRIFTIILPLRNFMQSEPEQTVLAADLDRLCNNACSLKQKIFSTTGDARLQSFIPHSNADSCSSTNSPTCLY